MVRGLCQPQSGYVLLPPAGVVTAWPVVSPLRRRIVRVFVLAIAVLAGGGLVGLERVERSLEPRFVPVDGVSIYPLFIDATPLPLTVSVAWDKVPTVATADALRSDPTLWRRMNVDDWDRIPTPLRETGLVAMLARFADLVVDPVRWDGMTAIDWDEVPQPIRALAYRHMTEFWSGFYGVGLTHDIPRGTMADTLSAIVMTESWFDHRAVNTNEYGRDLGVAQASDSARERLERLYLAGEVDFRLEDDDYFNPWLGTRFVAVWMNRLLDSLGGDLDAAVRAYHRGAARARRGGGEPYLETVKRRRRFLRGEGNSAAWTFLTAKAAELAGAARPWLSAPSPERTVAVESQVGEARVLEPADWEAHVPEALTSSGLPGRPASGLQGK